MQLALEICPRRPSLRLLCERTLNRVGCDGTRCEMWASSAESDRQCRQIDSTSLPRCQDATAQKTASSRSRIGRLWCTDLQRSRDKIRVATSVGDGRDLYP